MNLENEKEIKKPEWCDYPEDATHSIWGCWSLIDDKWRSFRAGKVEVVPLDRDYCKDCECYLDNVGVNCNNSGVNYNNSGVNCYDSISGGDRNNENG